jgi:hypothetical protein
MAIEVTEKWSAWRFDGDSAHREFQVTGAPTPQEALAACPVQFNQPHDLNPDLKAHKPNLGWGWNVRPIYVDYSVPSFGGGHTDITTPRIAWSRTVNSEPTDFDVNGNKIRNAAGDGFTPKLTRNFVTRTFTIFKYFTEYDVGIADRFEETVNAADWTVPFTTITYKKQTVKCVSIMPTQEYALGAPNIELAFTFERRARNRFTTAADKIKPFQPAVLNQGRRGWYDDNGVTKPGDIVDPSGKRVTEDVLLDSLGQPLNSAYQILGEDKQVHTPTVAPSPEGPDPAFDYTLIDFGDLNRPALLMIWDTVGEENFNDLPLP